MSVAVKLCGFTSERGLREAVEGGASYIGFLFSRPESYHFVTPAQVAPLLKLIPPGVTSVGLLIDPKDEAIEAVTSALPGLGMIQLHGFETPSRVLEIKKKTGKKVIKVFHVAAPEDLTATKAYEDVADMFLFDTKIGMQPSGGTGESFDWSILKGRFFGKPWMLAGGLNLSNVGKAVRISGAKIVDLSSGVETDKQKDPEKIRAFMELAKNSLSS